MRNKIVIAAVLLNFATPLFTSALTIADLQQQFLFISSQLKTLQSQTGAVAVAAAGAAQSRLECPILTRTLTKGDVDATTGGEVTVLQNFLVRSGEISPDSFAQMSKGSFGNLTQVALESWQTQHNLLATGKTDAVTRSAIATCAQTEIPVPSINFSANKKEIAAGEEVLLTWDTQHATRCSIQFRPVNGQAKDITVSLNDSMRWQTQVSSTVTLSCTNNVGTEANGPETTRSVDVKVISAPAPSNPSGLSQVSAALVALEKVLRQLRGF